MMLLTQIHISFNLHYNPESIIRVHILLGLMHCLSCFISSVPLSQFASSMTLLSILFHKTPIVEKSLWWEACGLHCHRVHCIYSNEIDKGLAQHFPMCILENKASFLIVLVFTARLLRAFSFTNIQL